MAHTSIPRSPVYASPSCNMYVTWRNHGTHSNESCRTHQYRDHLHDLCMFHPPATCMRHDSFMSHVGASVVTHMHPPQLPQWPVWRSFLQHEYDMTHYSAKETNIFNNILQKKPIFSRRLLVIAYECKTFLTSRHSPQAKMHRLPSLERVISAKEPYN